MLRAHRFVPFSPETDALTQTRALKYSVLKAFFDYAISRGYASRSPHYQQTNRRNRSPRHRTFIPVKSCGGFSMPSMSLWRAHGRLDANTVRTLLLIALWSRGARRRSATPDGR